MAAKYKLSKNVEGSKSFRFNGNKYQTATVTQKTLKKLFLEGFLHVAEIKETKKPVKNGEAKNDNPSN
tara:strand:+ start:124 stop:327 length:204 start_codon:yes stop_codon:yes gene_type:complete